MTMVMAADIIQSKVVLDVLKISGTLETKI